MAKKARKSIGEHFSPTIIYREDIEDIYDTLSESSKDVIIEADGHSFDNLDELLLHNKDIINELKMRIYNPYVSIDFEKQRIWLYIDNNTNEQFGAYEKIKYVVKKRRNWVHWIFSKFDFGLSLILTAMIVAVLYKYTQNLLLLGATVLLNIVAIFWILYWFLIISKKYTQIVLAYQKDKELSFFKRNKDELILLAIGILASAIIAYIFKN